MDDDSISAISRRTYLARVLLAVGITGAQERAEYLLVVSGGVEHLLAHAVLDNWHLLRREREANEAIKSLTRVASEGRGLITHLYFLQHGGHTAAVLKTSPACNGGHAASEVSLITGHANGHCRER